MAHFASEENLKLFLSERAVDPGLRDYLLKKAKDVCFGGLFSEESIRYFMDGTGLTEEFLDSLENSNHHDILKRAVEKYN